LPRFSCRRGAYPFAANPATTLAHVPSPTGPISFIGTGKDLNLAIDNGLQRAAELLQMSVPDVKNRATILGGIEIGRSPGVARVTFRAPTAALERVCLRALAEEIYG
jgi:hypothetical protein